jgi:uncharacterized protein YlbG (UPF0298 family)
MDDTHKYTQRQKKIVLLYMNIEDVSNPDVVLKRAKRLYGNDVQIYFSTHRDKKCMIHFGSSLYKDYTKHGDDKRRQRFHQRNHKWKTADPYTPPFASYFLLW